MKYFKALKHVPDPHQGIMYGKGTIIAVDDEKLACTDRELWEEVEFPTLSLLSEEMRKNVELEADNKDLNQRLADALKEVQDCYEIMKQSLEPYDVHAHRMLSKESPRERVAKYLKKKGVLNASFR